MTGKILPVPDSIWDTKLTVEDTRMFQAQCQKRKVVPILHGVGERKLTILDIGIAVDALRLHLLIIHGMYQKIVLYL